MFSSIRIRLTLWYSGVLALVLVIFSVGIYVILKRDLYAELDSNLKNTAEGTGVDLVRALNQKRRETQAASDALNDHIGPRQAAAIFTAGGQLISENPDLDGVHARLPNLNSGGNQAYLYTISQNGARRVVRKLFAAGLPPQNYLIVVSEPMDEVLNRLATIRLVLSLGISGALVLAALGGWFLARRSLAPVARMT